MKKVRINLKTKALNLRKRGLSLSEISGLIDIPKNTIQGWVKNVKLTKKQKARLKKKEIECGRKGLQKALKINREKIAKWKEDVRLRTEKFKNIIAKKSDIAKLLCGILYLCEGAKYPATRQLIFGNSDPRMIKSFLGLLRKNFNIDEKKFRCRIMHRYDQNGRTLNKYWSELTKIPLSQFYKSYKDKRSKGKVTKNKNYKGVCAAQYLSTDLQYELQLLGESVYNLKD
jgi:hypothetical protein